MENYQLPEGKVLVLRTVFADMTAYQGFKYPESGFVECKKWVAKNECGNGLHGWLWGEGDDSMRIGDDDRKWMVLEVEADSVIELDGKVKFPSANIIFCGDCEGAVALVQKFAPPGTKCNRATVTGGDAATVTGGDAATVTGGYAATVTGGYAATVTGGNRATVTGGDAATVTGGNRATVTGGNRATVTGGDAATVTGGDAATVTGGDAATVCICNDGGKCRAKIGGLLVFRFWSSEKSTYRLRYVEVDGETIKEDTFYTLKENQIIEA
jgi:hypothetical protein